MEDIYRKPLRILCAVVFAGCCIYSADWMFEGHNSKVKSEELAGAFYGTVDEAVPGSEIAQSTDSVSNGIEALIAINNDTAGWLKIEGTAIDYPIVKGADNTFYLTHNFNRNPDRHGAVFMDTRCEGTGLENTLIYGHNMKDGTVFRDLMEYRNESFYRDHRRIVYTNREGKQYGYDVIGVFYWDGETNLPFSFYETVALDGVSFWEYLSYLRECAFYETDAKVEKISPLLTLVTCDNDAADARIVVVAILSEEL